MTWLEFLWPFGKKRKERLAREAAVEAAFKKQLAEAETRQGDLQAVVDRMKADREKRRRSYPSLNAEIGKVIL